MQESSKKWENRHILGFRDSNKVNKISSVTLMLVLTASITNHLMLGFLIDDESSCNFMYVNIFMNLGLHDLDLVPYEGRNLFVFNDFIIHPSRVVEFLISDREEKDELIMNMYFLVIPWSTLCNFI